MNNQPTKEEQVHHQHHHHHHSSHDAASSYKMHIVRKNKFKRIFGKALYYILVLLAIAIMAYVYWIYTNE